MANELKCPICGNPTRIYMGNARKDRLCGNHANMLKTGKIYLGEDGQYHNEELNPKPAPAVKTPEPTKTNPQNHDLISETDDDDNEKPQVIVIDSISKSRCLICGSKTDGVLFCKTHYHKFKNKQLLFQINHCTEVKLLDESYEGIYTCKDGHIVKSKSEREIDNYLYSQGIRHAYEKTWIYDDNGKPAELKPDFYLPDYLGKGEDVYIEHWGYDDSNYRYRDSRKYKMSIYSKSDITLVCTYERTDMKDIEAALQKKLTKEWIKPHQINHTTEDN